MEEIVALAIPLLWGLLLIRLLLTPLRLIVKLLLHAACGFGCLWMLNLLAPFTGVLLSINAVTIIIAGILGIPGIALICLLAIL